MPLVPPSPPPPLGSYAYVYELVVANKYLIEEWILEAQDGTVVGHVGVSIRIIILFQQTTVVYSLQMDPLSITHYSCTT